MQAYALQETVKSLYPNADVKIINFINIKHFVINTLGWFLNYKNRRNIKHIINIYSLPFTLYHSRKKYMHLTSVCFTAAAINKMNFDTIIIGSDEVWNYSDKKSFSAIKFGHGISCKNIIAYAPSIGNSQIYDIPHVVISGLKKFNHLSARDKNTKLLIEHITGKIIPEVLDPTLLYPLKREPNPDLQKDEYILFYYCEHLPEKIKAQIFDYASKHNLKILGAGESDVAYEKCTVNITPFQWIDMFYNARFVFTGTFHGVVFSLLNHRQFKVYLTNKGRKAKVCALLDSIGISNRIIEDDYKFDLTQIEEIDYNTIQDIINTKKSTSIEYLKNAISSDDNTLFQ